MSIYINTLKDLDFIRIGLASPEKVESWSHGEVKKPETINYRTLKPEKDGLFCERIFGTTKDWECACGKYKKSRFRGVICDKCGVEVTKSKVRRERMGHIKLAAPVCHIWYFKGIPSRISALLELTNKEIERILYYITYIITELDEEAISAHKPAIIDAVQKELEIIRNPDKGIETSVKYSFPRVMLDEFGLGDQYVAEPIVDANGKTLFSENTIIDMDVVKRLIKEKVESLKVKLEKDAEEIDEVNLIRSFEIHLKKFHPLEDIVDEETGEVIASPDDKGFTTDAVTRMLYSGKSYTLLSKRMKMKLEKRVKDDEEKESQLEQGILLIDQLKKRQLLSEQESRWLMRIRAVAFKHRGLNLGEALKFEMGASAIQKLLRDIDLKKGFDETWELLNAATGAKKVKLTKKLKILKHFLDSGNRPEWMIIENLPVIPPELRPMVQLEGGRFAASDINDLYRRVINRNNRLKRLIEIRAPESIIKNEKRMLQEAVDALIDNGRRGKPIVGSTNRPLKSLSDLLKGKQGRFRQNLLGKRVDYSGRSVIVVGPELKLGQCGLPKVMALELFKPFVLKKLEERGLAMNIRAAKGMIERADSDVWDVLEEVIQGHPVLLNRAPTLHRLGVQAFIPTLVEGKAIQIHPLVCAAFNADFDGDQMAVHVPLSLTAQAEAKVLMMASNNLLLPADGKPIATPSHDMVLGLYFMTIDTRRQLDDLTEKQQREVPLFANDDEVVYAWETGQKHIHDYVRVRVPHEMIVPSRIPGPGDELVDNDDLHTRPMEGNIVLTTVGRLLVNRQLPEGAPFYNLHIGKGRVRKIIAYIYAQIGRTATVEMLDAIKEISFEMATAAGVTIGMDDMQIPKEKAKIIDKSEKAVLDLVHRRKEGKLTEKEKYDRSIKVWTQATDDVTKAMMDGLDPLNPIYMMAISGARGKVDQMRQLAAMRGLMADPSGRTIEIPITSNFMEGLTVLEYFISTHGARKGLADTALRTADSGYLTRRLVDVAQDILVTEDDCGTEDYILLEDMLMHTSNRKGAKGKVIEPLSDRVLGRVSAEDFVDPKTGELIVGRNQMINEERVRILNACGFKQIKVRSILTCESAKGVCRKCYGRDLATGDLVDQGEPIGIVAAQAIGEPGTQLTMRTFHTGGVAGFDITQGLPHVELLFELFDARYQRKGSTVTPMAGTVSLKDESGMLVVYPEKMTAKEAIAKAQVEARKRSRKELGDVFVLTAEQLHGKVLCVEDGEKVEMGDPLTEGDINPRDILRFKGIREAESFMVAEVQRIYKSQGVNTNDKHIEVIIRQMLKYQQIADPKDSEFLEGDLVNRFVLAKYARGLKEQGLKAPEVIDLLLGISKASLKTESFLSAASFQETTKVLSNAAVEGRIDRMVGLKENVIIGRLVPVGTGQPELKNLSPLKEGEEPPALDVTRDDISIAEIIDRAEAQTSETIVPPAES